MTCSRYDFALWQGKTFRRVVRWESLPYIYKAITAITNAAPVSITAAGHGLPDGWRAAVISSDVRQLDAKNAPPQDEDYHKSTVVSSSVVTFNDVNASDYEVYASGGYLTYLTPVDLASYTARLMIKDRVGGDVLLSLTNVAGITLDNTAKTITILITATQTAAMDFSAGVYELEMVAPDGFVTPLLYGDVTVTEEVTV